MLMNRFAVMLILIASTLPVRQKIELRDPGGIDTVTFPSDSFSENEIKTIMRLSPKIRMANSYPVFYPLEMCIKGESAYRACGTKDAHGKWFVANANVNIQQMEDALKGLDKMPQIDEVNKIVQYERSLQVFYLKIEKVRLKFTLSRRTSLLEEPIENIDPRIQCAESLSRIRSAPSKEAADEIVRHDWYSCMNHQMLYQAGPYPIDAWESFLHKSQIQEKYVPVDDE
ncbi:MAG TPA: hypothetical protein VH593_09730, partial [Ktedonobacteraceae bacterium]